MLFQFETATTTDDSDNNGNNDDDDDGDDDDNNYVSISARSLLYQWSLEQLSFDAANEACVCVGLAGQLFQVDGQQLEKAGRQLEKYVFAILPE